MAVDKLVDSTQLDADLTSVANAIRTKGGTSASLAFPADFVQAIGDIPSGGGNQELYDFLSGATSGAFKPDGLTRLRAGAFYRDTSITSMHFKDVTEIGNAAITSCNGVTVIVFEKPLTGYLYAKNQMCYGNGSQLTTIDLHSFMDNSQGSDFQNNNGLNLIILRSTTLVPLKNTNVIATNTCFKSGGTGGTIYIPKALYDHLGDGGSSDYKAATNWSAVNGYGTITWAQIEGSQYENYYADGTPIT